MDAILVDLNLLDSQGWDTYVAVRAQAPHVPIIILTETEDEALALESIRKGAQDCLVRTECTRNLLARVIRYAMERCRAEEELRRSERRHRRLIASTTDYIYTVALDPDGGSSTHHGAACVTVTGYSAGEFEADPRLWFWMIHEQDRAAVLAQIDRVMYGRTPPPLEHRILHKDGGIRWIKNAMVPHLDPQGKVTAYDGLISDITERKCAEQLLRVQYRVTCELAGAPTLHEALTKVLQIVCENFLWDVASYWSFDSAAQVLHCGERWNSPSADLEEFGVSSQAFAFTPGEGLPGRVWARGEAVWIADILRDGNFPRAALAHRAGLHTGCAFPVQHGSELLGVVDLFSRQIQQPNPWMLQVLSAVGSQIGQFVERKRAEAALRESQERLALVLRGSADGIWDWNMATGQVYFSPRWKSMLGYGEHEVEDSLRGWEQLLHPDDRDRALGQIQAHFAGQAASYELEHRLRHKDGSYRWILARGVALRDAGGKPVRMAGSHVDVTERKQSEEQLKRALAEMVRSEATLRKTLAELDATDQQLKATHLQLIQAAKMESIGTLAAGVAHEVKNPLQTILMGLTYLAHQAPPENENIALALDEMRNAVKRADVIIRELLQLSAATRVEMHEDDLNAVVERSLSLIHYEMLATQTAVVRQLNGDLPRVRLDRHKMEQVFVNLFLNACQAMPQGGTLTVRTWSERWTKAPWRNGKSGSQIEAGETVVVTQVEDTGGGIPEKVLPRVFDAFFSTKPSGVGTGLGLSVVKNIIDLHGGVVGIENVLEGGVRVTLILKTQPEGTPQKMRPPLLLEGQGQPIGASDYPV